MRFNMLLTDNFASFIDEKTGTAVFVDSFDNKEFEVRIGTIDDTKAAGAIQASSNEELNGKLAELLRIHQAMIIHQVN